jgi:hypothetical protein
MFVDYSFIHFVNFVIEVCAVLCFCFYFIFFEFDANGVGCPGFEKVEIMVISAVIQK